MQTKKGSAIEAVANVGSGVIIAFIVQQILFPLMGIPVSTGEGLFIVLVFTTVSLIRSYIWRRIFNNIESKKE